MSTSPPVLLEEEFFPTDSARMTRWFPWLRLLRAFHIAIDPRLLLVALLAILIWSSGETLILKLAEQSGITAPLPLVGIASALTAAKATDLSRAVAAPWDTALNSLRYSAPTLWPLQCVMAFASFLLEGTDSWGAWGMRWGLLAWTLLVTGVSGGLICRMAALKSGPAGGASLSNSFRFALKRAFAYACAPLMAFIGFSLLWFAVAGMGFLARIPGVGEWLLAIVWPISLVIGFLMALLVVIVNVGWPLMIAAISVESSDSFDGLSRANTYLLNRPLYAVFLALFAVAYGGVLLFFVSGLTDLAASLTSRALAVREGNVTEAWLGLVRLVPLAFVYSYFWTATTMIYLLLRRREDATPLTEIKPDDTLTESRSPPLVGMPAAAERERATGSRSAPPQP